MHGGFGSEWREHIFLGNFALCYNQKIRASRFDASIMSNLLFAVRFYGKWHLFFWQVRPTK